MKRIISLFALASLAVLSLSCEKEIESPEPAKAEVYTYSFEAFDADADKSTFDGSKITWKEGDQVGYFVNDISGNSEIGSDQKFTISTTKPVTGETLYAYVPYVDGNAAATTVNITIPELQASDNLVMPAFGSATVAADGVVPIKLSNLGSIVAFKLYSATGAYSSEKVTSITMTSTTNAICGTFTKDITASSSLEISGYDKNAVTVSVNGDLTAASSKENAPVVYAVIAPGTYDGNVVVTTDVATYTYPFSSQTFQRSHSKGLVLNFEKAGVRESVEPTPDPVYRKVTSTSDLTDGKYLIVYEAGKVALNGALTKDVASNTVSVEISNGKIVSSAQVDAAAVTYSAADGSFLGGGGQYIGHTGTSNTLNYSKDALSNTVSFDDKGNVVIDAGSDYVLRYNKTSGQERFRYYKGTQETIQLYKYTGITKEDQILSFSQESYDVVLGETFTAPTVTGAQTTVTYSSSDNEVATVDAITGAVQILSAGEVTITATACSDDTYNEGSASYTISIIDPHDALTTVAAIYEASAEAGNYMVTFDNWVVSGVKDNNVYVTDGTKGFIIFKSEHGFMAGDILSGTVNSCALTRYNGAAEFTNISSSSVGLTVTKGGSVIPATISISELSGVNTGAVITFDDLTYNGTVFTDGTNDIKPYNTFITLPSLKSGAHYNVTGVYIQYGTTKEIAPRTAEDISEIAATQYDVIIASGILNGSVSANPTKAAAGVEVTLTATPATGYGLDAWIVKDAGNNAITVTNNKFTMPASNVTVSATFKDVSSESGVVIFDFTSADALTAMGITPPASSDGTTLTSCALNPITIINTKNGGTETRVWNSNGNFDLRVYKTAEFTITSSSNAITKVEFDGTGVASASTGTYNNKIWTGSSSSVTFTCSSTSNGNIKTIKVTYGNPPYLSATADKTNASAAGETVTITVDTNVEGWTVTSDNAAFTVGAKSGNTVPVTVSENTSTTDGRTANITVSATGVPDVVISLTQDKAAGGGQGGTIPKGTILWAENFAHFGTKTPSDAGTGTGTTIYGDAQIAYSQSSDNTKGYDDKLAGGTAPELLLSKSNQTWTISGISCDGASEMTLTFLSNKTSFAVSSSTDNIKVSGSQKSWTITNTGAKFFDITIKNTGSSNARIDDVELKVK